jgi:hypothetical protein
VKLVLVGATVAALVSLPPAAAQRATGAHPYGTTATLSPRPPRAGKLYTAIIGVGIDGGPVADATVTAKLVIHHRAAPHTARLVKKFFVDSAAHVVWHLPQSARNKYITATVTVWTANGGVANTWNAIAR